MSGSPFAAVADGVRVTLRAAPGASKNAVTGFADTAAGGKALKVAVTAVAEAGKANEAVIKLLSKLWRLPKSSFTLVAGASDRNKIVHVSGNPEELMARLSAHHPEEKQP